MSAEIISLQAWRQQHCAHHEPEARSEDRPVSVPFLLPTWPYGWLQPMLVEVDMGLIAELFALTPLPRTDRHPRQSAAIHRLVREPVAQGKAAGNR
jgi:hypothetical protein